ncbi:MAG: rhomboid family intramembrane serine protease, partial [Geminicoccaceae bacterium]
MAADDADRRTVLAQTAGLLHNSTADPQTSDHAAEVIVPLPGSTAGDRTINPSLRSSRPSPPAINLPPLTLALLIVMFGIYGLTLIAPAEFEHWTILHFAFIPAAWFVDIWPIWSLAVAPLTYAFLHGGLLHLALNGVMLAVMGQVLERKLGMLSFFTVFAAGAIGGALVHALIGGSPEVPLVGASAGVGALYGAGLVLHGRGISLGPNTQTLLALTAFFVVTNLLGVVLPALSRIAY